MIRVGLAVTLSVCVHVVHAGGGLYGTIEPTALVSVNEGTGTLTPLSNGSLPEGQAQELSAFDPLTGTYYILGYNFTSKLPNLVGINLSGLEVSSVKLPFSEEAFVGVGQAIVVEPKSGHIICSGQFSPKSNFSIVQINPKTGDYVVKATIGGPNEVLVLDGATAYDAVTSNLYLSLDLGAGINLYAINLVSQAITKIVQDPSSGKLMDTMDYDATSNTIFGFGVKQDSTGGLVRTVTNLDPKSGVISIVGEVKGYTIESGNVATLDSENGRLFGLFQKDGANTTDPFYLVSVDTSDASVIHAAEIGDIAALPWTLEYAN